MWAAPEFVERLVDYVQIDVGEADMVVKEKTLMDIKKLITGFDPNQLLQWTKEGPEFIKFRKG